MRKYILLILISICSIKIKAQCGTPMTYSIQVTSETCTGCCDGMAQVLNLQGGCPPYMYSWSQGSGMPEQNGLCTGSFTLTIYNNCCPPVTQTFSVTSGTTTGLNQIYEKNNCQIYPNPNNGSFKILFDETKQSDVPVTVSISNLLGQTVYSKTYENSSSVPIEVNSEDLIKGVYIITLVQNNNNFGQSKLVIE